MDTAGKNASRIAEYIKNQLQEDRMGEQMTMSQYGPFTGGKQLSFAIGRPYLRVSRACCEQRALPASRTTTGCAGGCLLGGCPISQRVTMALTRTGQQKAGESR